MPEITDRDSLEAWLATRPHEDAVLIAARAALRVLPLLGQSETHRASVILPVCRALAVASLAGKWPRLATEVRNAADVADAHAAAIARAAFPPAASYAAAAAAHAAAHAAAAAYDASQAAAAQAPRADAGAARDAVTRDAIALEVGTDHAAFDTVPLWRSLPPKWTANEWQNLSRHLLDAGEGWEVWTGWYEALLQGVPQDPALELAKALIPDEIWKQGPSVVNAEIARLIAEHHAARPQGELLEYDPTDNRIGSIPAEIESPTAYENAVSQVEDTLEIFRRSAVANRAYGLNPVLQRLDLLRGKHRDNPLRVHDELARAARNIASAIEADPEINAIETRDLRDVCGQGAIDVRIAVRAVSEMEQDRRRRTARQPGAHARSATDRLLDEIGLGLKPDLREDIREDAEIIEGSGAEEGDVLPEGDARDAMLRMGARLGWLQSFARMSSDRIVALAQRTERTVGELEELVTLFRGAESWWGVIDYLLKSL